MEKIKRFINSYKLYKITSIVSFIIFVLVVNSDKVNDIKTLIFNFTFVLFVLFIENYYTKERNIKKSLIISVILATLLYLVYDFIENNYFLEVFSIIFIIILIHFVFYERFIKINLYSLKFINNILITIVFSVVLMLGLIFLYYLVHYLFKIDIKNFLEKIVYFIIFVFSFNFFSSLSFKNDKYSALYKFLFYKIFIPLISIYTLILYIYFVKILITNEIPRSTIGNLTFWYLLFTSTVLFFTNFNKENKFFKYISLSSIPISFMLIFAIYIRVYAYGFTIKRYLMLAVTLWLIAVNIYYLFRNKKEKYILYSLIFLILFVLFTPFNAEYIEKISQLNMLKRFEKINNKTEEEILNYNSTIRLLSSKGYISDDKKEIVSEIEMKKQDLYVELIDIEVAGYSRVRMFSTINKEYSFKNIKIGFKDKKIYVNEKTYDVMEHLENKNNKMIKIKYLDKYIIINSFSYSKDFFRIGGVILYHTSQ